MIFILTMYPWFLYRTMFIKSIKPKFSKFILNIIIIFIIILIIIIFITILLNNIILINLPLLFLFIILILTLRHIPIIIHTTHTNILPVYRTTFGTFNIAEVVLSHFTIFNALIFMQHAVCFETLRLCLM